ncbi:MAG: hypothetical protein ACRELZ_24420, partial [Candidatus Rokuibacteriota bacterium]
MVAIGLVVLGVVVPDFAAFGFPAAKEPASIVMTIFGVPTQALFGQLLIGLINGAFYALLSLGLSV